jgi:hypothetical protein
MREMSETLDIQPLSSVRQVQRLREKMDIAYQEHLQRQEAARLEAQRVADEERLREEEVRRQQQRRMAATVEKTPFPPPPLPGTKEIVPITSIMALRAEGKEQYNCVGSYGWRILQGNAYFYRVMKPQRSTLLIIRLADGNWYRSEFKGTNNVAVGRATIRVVDAWLAAQRVSV